MNEKQIFTAQAADVSSDGVTLILPNQTQPTHKAYRRLASAAIAAGDRVLCARDSGTIVVLGKIM